MNKTSSPIRLQQTNGHNDMKNDIIYQASSSEKLRGTAVFFGGDTQDYEENMLLHRDSKAYVKWNLESTASLLHERFPQWDILVVKPSHMHLKTFSCFHNFVEGNDFGAPVYKSCLSSLVHLKLLLQNAISQYKKLVASDSVDQSDSEPSPPISIIGFSKGCVVLNQFLYSFTALSKKPDENLLNFVKCIKNMYWLDGGHSGTSDCWITDKKILENFVKTEIKIGIHVTPYQVLCETRPRIGKEEKIFRETLRRLGADIERKIYFEDCPRSLEYHFKVIEVFSM